MLKTITLTLDVEKGDDRFATLDDRIELRQGDALAYALEVSLREKSEVLDLTGKAVRFYAQTPDGAVAIDGEHVSVPSPQDGVIRYEVPPEITQTAGNIDMAYFRITDEDPDSHWSASTPNIPFSIRRGIAIKLRDGDYFPEFDAALADLEASRVAYEQAEDARQTAEAARATAEEARAAAELLRLTAEEERDGAEALRLAAELERDAAELDRMAAEGEREAAEEDRSLAELARSEAEAYRAAKFAEIEERADGLLYYFCSAGEYDPDTRHPLIAEPHAGTHYLTPASHPTENNHWDEWLWDAAGQRWEGYGSQDVVIDPMTVDQAEALFDGSEADGTEGELVSRRILRFVLGKLDGLYAKLAHTHSGADITDGTVTNAKLADGSVSLAKCDQSLRDSVSRAKLKAIDSQSDDVFWFLTGAAGSKRVVFGGDSVGSSKNSHGYVWVDTPPIKVQSVSRNFSVAANGYTDVAVNAPAVSGYTYLGLVGCRQGVDARLILFSMSPSDIGIASRANAAISGSITLTLLYGRNGS